MHYFKNSSKQLLNYITTNNTRKYIAISLPLGIIVGATTSTLLLKFSNIKKSYINILIGFGLLFGFGCIAGAIGYTKDQKTLINRENSPSELPGIIKQVSEKVLSDNSTPKYYMPWGNAPIVTLDYEKVKNNINSIISQNKYYHHLSTENKKNLKGIIFGQVYLDLKYPNMNKSTSIEIDTSNIDFKNQNKSQHIKSHIEVNIATAAFISQGIDDIKLDNYDNRKEALKIRFINTHLKDTKQNIIGKMAQYRKIKQDFSRQQNIIKDPNITTSESHHAR